MTDDEVLAWGDKRRGTCSCCDHWSLKGSYGDINHDSGKCFANRDENDFPTCTRGGHACEKYREAPYLAEIIFDSRRYMKAKGIIQP